MLRQGMYNKIKSFASENFKMLIAAFMLGVLVPYVSPMMLVANATQFDPYSLEDAAVKYHQKADEIVDGFLERLITTQNPDVTFVASEEGCSSSSASTYCLAAALNPLLDEYLTYLNKQKSIVEADELDFDSRTSLKDAFDASLTRETLIDTEILAAVETMDLTLAVYNQIQLVYPVHKEFEALVKSLQGFNNGLADIRNYVELFPGKFNDATTIECK